VFYALIIICAVTVTDCDVEHATWLDESDPTFKDAEACFEQAEKYLKNLFDDTWPHRTIIICTEQSTEV
jgi:hypothetical protein